MRFATPNRSKPRVLAKSPPRPVLQAPGHRYGSGTPVKGASIKGRHYIDINVDGQRKRSPTTPRTPSPNSRAGSRDDITIESSVPSSTKKAFEKPKRKDRSPRKDPIPVRNVSPTRISRDGFSVNAEVVSVGSESFSRSGLLRAKSSSSLQSRSNDNQSVSGNSVLSTRSTLSKGTSSGATISAVSTGSLYQSLSQSSPPAHGIHNLQLTQKAFKSIRKACVRDAISQFLESEEDYQANVYTKQYLNSVSRSLSADSLDQQYYRDNALLKKQERIMKMTEVLRKSIHDELNSYPPKLEQQLQDIFFPSENMYDPTVVQVRESIANILLDWKKSYLKETLSALDKHFASWEKARNHLEAVHQVYYQQQIPQFQYLIEQKQSKQQELIQLRNKAEALGLDIQSLVSNFPVHWFEEDELKEDILEDIHGFDLNDYRKYADDQMLGSPIAGGEDGFFDDQGEVISPAAQRREIDKAVNSSVFLSPHLLQVGKPLNQMKRVSILGNDDSYYDNNYPESPQRGGNVSQNYPSQQGFPDSPSKSNLPPPPSTDQEHPSNMLAHSSFVPFMNTEDGIEFINPTTTADSNTNSNPTNNIPADEPIKKTPYQVSDKNIGLLAPAVLFPASSNKLKINYNVIRVLGSTPQMNQFSTTTPAATTGTSLATAAAPPLASKPPMPPSKQEADLPLSLSLSHMQINSSPRAPLPPEAPTPNSLQYSVDGTFFGSPRPNVISPFSNQGLSRVEEEQTIASTSSAQNSSYMSAGTSSQLPPEIDEAKERKRSIHAKLKKKYSPKS